jgi:hypothetical protein
MACSAGEHRLGARVCDDARNVDARFVETPNSPRSPSSASGRRATQLGENSDRRIGVVRERHAAVRPVRHRPGQRQLRQLRRHRRSALQLEQATDNGAVDIFRGDEDQRWITDGGISGNLERTGRRAGSCRELEIAVQARRATACAVQVGSATRAIDSG